VFVGLDEREIRQVIGRDWAFGGSHLREIWYGASGAFPITRPSFESTAGGLICVCNREVTAMAGVLCVRCRSVSRIDRDARPPSVGCAVRRRPMVILRGCRKCDGDLYVEENIDGTDLVCLQCGHRQVEPVTHSLERQPLRAVRAGTHRPRAAL
jgi:hypothetical protein